MPTLADSHDTHFGIGLWIARRNVEALGGSIQAENRRPNGLLMRVRLPLAEVARLGANPTKTRGAFNQTHN